MVGVTMRPKVAANIRATWRHLTRLLAPRSAASATLLLGALLFWCKINSLSALEPTPQQAVVGSGGPNSLHHVTTSATTDATTTTTTTKQYQPMPQPPQTPAAAAGGGGGPSKIIKKCTRQSIILARQMLVHELNQMNNYMPIWFNDLDKDELVESQRHSLSNIVMSGYGTKLLHSNGQPLIEIESSYFRSTRPQNSPPGHHNSHHYNNNINNNNNNMNATTSNRYSSQQPHQQSPPLSIKLIRRHQDRCYLNSDKSQYTYVIGLSIGPIEHHLDVLYNLPKELSLGQPIDWRYGQITLYVPKMIYEITLKQVSTYKLNSLSPFSSNCPLDIVDVLYLPPNLYTTSAPSSAGPQQMQTDGQQQQQQQLLVATSNSIGANTNKPQMSITSSGLALNNQTMLQVERLFDDYTRPTISRRLRQMLKFNLNTKTLPLACA